MTTTTENRYGTFSRERGWPEFTVGFNKILSELQEADPPEDTEGRIHNCRAAGGHGDHKPSVGLDSPSGAIRS